MYAKAVCIRALLQPPPGAPRGPGAQAGGAISKPSKRKAGATVQPQSVQAPRLSAACQAFAGTTACGRRSEEHTSELQSLMRISYAVFCLKKKTTSKLTKHHTTRQAYT